MRLRAFIACPGVPAMKVWVEVAVPIPENVLITPATKASARETAPVPAEVRTFVILFSVETVPVPKTARIIEILRAKEAVPTPDAAKILVGILIIEVVPVPEEGKTFVTILTI
jgi:hypothetical protein